VRGKLIMNRDKKGRFAKSFVGSFIGAVILIAVAYVAATYQPTMASVKPAAVYEAPKTETFEDFYNKKVEEYKKTPEYIKEKEEEIKKTEGRMEEIARLRVMNAIMVRAEQVDVLQPATTTKKK